jgi:hypothetical protein
VNSGSTDNTSFGLRGTPAVRSGVGPRRRALLLLALLAAACSSDNGARRDGAPGSDLRSTGDAPAADQRATDARREASPADRGRDAPGATLKVLFVGNSYSFGLPDLVNQLSGASSGAPAVKATENTTGGATLKMHFDDAATLSRIASGGWHYVVLQGQSVEPVYNPSQFATYAGYLATRIKQARAVPVFFETWARKAGHEVYSYSWSGGTPKAMQAGLRKAYQTVASQNGGKLAPVGDAWEQVLASHPSIPLFAADGSHPTAHGTYLAACVFYALLTGNSPVGLSHRPASVSAADAAALQKVARQTVQGKGSANNKSIAPRTPRRRAGKARGGRIQ